MLTGGFKTRAQAEAAVASRAIDVVGLARALVLDPSLPMHWKQSAAQDPAFPRFTNAPEGGITAWYTMRLTALAEGTQRPAFDNPCDALAAYEARDAERTKLWLRHFTG